MAFKILLFNQFFSGGGGREGKGREGELQQRSALLSTTPCTTKFAVCRPMYKEKQDSLGFWISRSGFRIPDTGFQSLSEELGFWIPIVSGIRNLELYSGFD